MYTFFHGWRRKAGVVTLVMACAVVTGWVRSLHVRDTVELPMLNGRVESDNQSLALLRDTSDLVDEPSLWPIWRSSQPARIIGPFNLETRNQMFCGFGRSEVGLGFYYGVRYLIPYWSLAIPLIALSAYLILWKPRERDSGPPRSETY